MPSCRVGVRAMSRLPISRDEQLAKLAAALGAADDVHGAVQRDRPDISNEDLALLLDAIDSGELWRLLEQRPELCPVPAAHARKLKWSELVKAAVRSDADGDAAKG